jgi:predicted ATPase
VVEENNLQVHVSALRKLLGPQTITTIPGRGYRFTLDDSGSAPQPAAAPSAPPRPAQGPARTPGNLPARLPELFGRADDVRAVRELLAVEALASIVGAGGIGKTRLALEVGSEFSASNVDSPFADGVWWIELAALSDPAMVPNAVAQVLGVSRAAERPLADTLVAVLREQRLLLILDNCEHLLDAVATLVEVLLRNCPGVRVLLTSQEPTRLPEERAYRLGSLAVPAMTDAVDANAGAIALFIARAQAADRLLRFDAPALATVAEICRALDGIPLAIELAAARVPLLGFAGLRDRLHERFKMLTGGSRMLLRRHQTLRAALEWSHGLLSDDERVVFRRLAVFAGGFSLPLAQAVAADERIDGWAVLDLLGHLVDKSLVTIDAQDNVAGPHYRLLETARAYAFEQLGAAGETQAWLRRHAQALYEMLLALYPTRWTHDAATRGRATAEIDNLRAALDWAAAPGGDPALGQALHGVSQIIWHDRGLLIEGQERYRRLPACALAPEIEARSQLAFARLGYLGAGEDCYRAAERAATLFKALGDDSNRTDALCTLVLIGSRREQRSEVEAALREIDQLVRPAWPARQRAGVALAHAMACLMRDDAAGAAAAAWRQHACYMEDGSRFGQLLAVMNASYYECLCGDYDAAIERLKRLPLDFRSLLGQGREPGIVVAYLAFAYLLRDRPGDLVRGLELAREAWPRVRLEQSGNWLLPAFALAQLRRGARSNAVRVLGYAEARLTTEGSVYFVWQQRQRDEVLALRDRVGAEQFDAWYEAGRLLDEDAAMKFAFALD